MENPREPEEERPADSDRGTLEKLAEEVVREAEDHRVRALGEIEPVRGIDDRFIQELLAGAGVPEPEQAEPAIEGQEEREDTAPASAASQPERKQIIQMTLPVGMLQCNCTIIGDPETREALVIDPGDEVERILELIGRHRLQVTAIVSTHAHIDHVGGLAKLHEYTGAPLLMHRDDLPLYRAMEMQAAFLGVAPPPIAKVDHLLKEGDPLRWGSLQASVIHTPGHTPGSICLHMPAVGANPVLQNPRLFSGDTLFAGSIGRTDLWGGSLDQIMDSLRSKILELADNTEVFPGHGITTVIGEERQSNPFLKKP